MKKFLFLICLPLLFCCSKKPNHKQAVLVSVAPYQSIIEQITEGKIDVIQIVPSGFNPHLFEPSPKQTIQYERANIFFGIGESFEKKISQAMLSFNKNFTYLNLAEYMPYLIHEHDHEGHHHAHDYDVHIWLDPVFLAMQINLITKELVKHFPEYTEEFESNAKQIINRLNQLNTILQSKLSPYKGQGLLVSHPSLSYFCKRYEIEQFSLEVEGKEPLPREIQSMLLKLQQSKVRCAFIQKGFNNKATKLIASKLKLPTYSVDPNANNYEQNMLQITQEFIGQP